MKTNKNKSMGVFLGLCPFCGKENGEILLDGRMKVRDNDPRHVVTFDACDKCKDLLNKGNLGIIIVNPNDIRKVVNERVNPKDVEKIIGGAIVNKDVFEQLTGNKVENNVVFIDEETFNFLFVRGEDGNLKINPDRIKQKDD